GHRDPEGLWGVLVVDVAVDGIGDGRRTAIRGDRQRDGADRPYPASTGTAADDPYPAVDRPPVDTYPAEHPTVYPVVGLARNRAEVVGRRQRDVRVSGDSRRATAREVVHPEDDVLRGRALGVVQRRDVGRRRRRVLLSNDERPPRSPGGHTD